MYNVHSSLTQTGLIQVPLVGAEQVAEKQVLNLRGFVISLTILVLIISLASRTVQGGIYTKSTVHSASVSTKIQHRDKDASVWVAPVATFSFVSVAEPSILRTSTQRVLLYLHYDSLYNRPPPIS